MMKIDESAFNKLFSSKVYGAIREFQVFKNLLFQRIHSYEQFFFISISCMLHRCSEEDRLAKPRTGTCQSLIG